ncbi:MAG: molecular chaperone [Leptothrix sp. (in: b-proteobacteria)]
MPATVQPLTFSPADGAEELARAELYGLIARLWLAPPDAALLRQFASVVTEAPEAGAFLEAPWQTLVGALRQATPQSAADEYDALFLGVGKPEVFLYGSYYLAGFLNERPLARLREDLSRLGLTRSSERGETEDHIAYLCEVMRYLIAGDEIEVCNLAQQRRFFRAHLQPWVEQLCEVVAAHPRAQLWRALADFTRAFVQVEMQGFDLLEE